MADNDQKQNFMVDTSDFLGFKYAEYCNEMYALALAKPSDYFDLRKKVLQSAKTDAVSDLYKTFYNLLSKGQDKTGKPIITTATSGDIQPSYPQQKVNEFALSAAATLDKIIQEAINIILPLDYKQIATERLAQKGGAGTIN
jgi:hypothetical protein